MYNLKKLNDGEGYNVLKIVFFGTLSKLIFF